MIGLKNFINQPSLPRTTIFGNEDSFAVIVNGQCVLLPKEDSNIPFLVDGVVPSQYIPYVQKEVEFVDDFASLPATGDSEILYVTRDTNQVYVWDSVAGDYQNITQNSLILGETSTTAYRGDRGKIAYDFSQGVEITTEGALDTIANGYFYPQTTLSVNNADLMWGMTFGNTNYEGQVIFCDNGLFYARYKDGGASYGDWNNVSARNLYREDGTIAVEINGGTTALYDTNQIARIDVDGDVVHMYNGNGANVLEVGEDYLSIYGDNSEVSLSSISDLSLVDATDKTKKTSIEVPPTQTSGVSRILSTPDTNGVIATEAYADNAAVIAIAGGVPSAKIGDVDNGNYTNISTDGHQSMEGDATVWEDDNFDPTMLTGNGTDPSARAWASTGCSVAGFRGTGLDEVELVREYPHKGKLNNAGETDVTFSFHAHVATEDANSGNMYFGLEYFFEYEGVPVTTSTTIYATVPTSGIAWAKHSFTFADIPAPEELGAQLHFRFFRDGGNVTDTYESWALVSTLGYHYEIDSIGSNEILVK